MRTFNLYPILRGHLFAVAFASMVTSQFEFKPGVFPLFCWAMLGSFFSLGVLVQGILRVDNLVGWRRLIAVGLFTAIMEVLFVGSVVLMFYSRIPESLTVMPLRELLDGILWLVMLSFFLVVMITGALARCELKLISQPAPMRNYEFAIWVCASIVLIVIASLFKS